MVAHSLVARRSDAPVPSPPPQLPPQSEAEEHDSHVFPVGWKAERVRTGGADWITQVSDTNVRHTIEYRRYEDGEAAILLNDKCEYLGPTKLEHEFRLPRKGPSVLIRVTNDIGIELWIDHQQVYPHRRSQPDPNTVIEHRASAIRAALEPFTGSVLLIGPDFEKTYETRDDKRKRKCVLDAISSPVIGLRSSFSGWVAITDSGLYLTKNGSEGRVITYEVLAGLPVETLPPEYIDSMLFGDRVLLGSTIIEERTSSCADETAGLLNAIKQVIIDPPERHVPLPRLRPQIQNSILDVKDKSFMLLSGTLLFWGLLTTVVALSKTHHWPDGIADLVVLPELFMMAGVGLNLRPAFFKISIILTIAIATVIAWGGGESVRGLFEYGWAGQADQIDFAIGNSAEFASRSFGNKATGVFMISPTVFTIVGAALIMIQWLRPSPP